MPLYEIRPVAAVLRRGGRRRRAGLEFRSEPVLVSTDEGAAGAQQVTTQQLDAILADEYLEHREIVTDAATGTTKKAPAKRRSTTTTKKAAKGKG